MKTTKGKTWTIKTKVKNLKELHKQIDESVFYVATNSILRKITIQVNHNVLIRNNQYTLTETYERL